MIDSNRRDITAGEGVKRVMDTHPARDFQSIFWKIVLKNVILSKQKKTVKKEGETPTGFVGGLVRQGRLRLLTTAR